MKYDYNICLSIVEVHTNFKQLVHYAIKIGVVVKLQRLQQEDKRVNINISENFFSKRTVQNDGV